ncbi:MAG: metallophosphoesterase [Clostridia bacterium]|nr:metallophosphoesterase [Clostridia bacterium]
MKTLVVLSDTHGSKKGVEALLPVIQENDYVLHLGDGLTEISTILEKKEKGVHFCAGNCDFFSGMPQEDILEIEDCKIFYCHGHTYGVKTSLERLAARAKSLGCTVALYGHTHRASVDEVEGVKLICPGSLRAPKDKGGSYAYLVVVGEKVTVALVGENPR